jgi:hypothetical protein
VEVAEEVILLILIKAQATVNFLQNAVGKFLVGEGGEFLGMDIGRDRPQQPQDGWVNENILDQRSHWKSLIFSLYYPLFISIDSVHAKVIIRLVVTLGWPRKYT